MAKNKKNQVVLENIELKPQVIGRTYKKKSNIFRVIFIFIVFILAVYYINDITVFINNLLGRDSADTIKNQTSNKKTNKKNENSEEIVYYEIDSSTSITEKELVLNNFRNENNTLFFDANNNTNAIIDLSNSKYFIETYSENKTLLERFKIDFNKINTNTKSSFSFPIKSEFKYITISEKKEEDYPNINLDFAEGNATIVCKNDTETITYTFDINGLLNISHTITDQNNGDDYYTRYNAYQSKATNYNNMDGISASFNATLDGYTVSFSIDLEKANLENISEKYYFKYKELPKVVKFEMETYGFSCE